MSRNYLNSMYRHMNDLVIGLFDMKDGNTVLFSADIDWQTKCYQYNVFTFYTFQGLYSLYLYNKIFVFWIPYPTSDIWW